MSGVFQNIDLPPPSPPGECVPFRLWCGGRTHSLGGEGVGVKILEDARHCSVLYICKYWKKKQILNVVFESCFQIGDHRPRKERCFSTLHRASHVLPSLRDTNQKEIFSLPLNCLVWSFLNLSHCYFLYWGWNTKRDRPVILEWHESFFNYYFFSVIFWRDRVCW